MKILSAAILLTFLFACSFMQVIDVPDTRKTGRENLAAVEFGLKKIEADLSTLATIHTKWTNIESHTKYAALVLAQRNILQFYVRTKEDFESSKFVAKGKVKQDDKDYLAVKKEQDDFNARFANLDNQLKKYREQRNAYIAFLETKQILRVDPQVTNKDFVLALNEAKKMQLQVKNELIEFNVKLNQSTDAESEKARKKLIIQELVKIVEKMENETFRLQRVHTATLQEIGPGVKFVRPGMRAHHYNDKIKLILDGISLEATNFNKLAATLNQ